ncbi:MAG: TIGR00725 family protein [Candidatus Coatesbacteria bacterium]|nr:TIGR00725 family protein [Candidatus Coatesbacteria bacterium]
MIVGVIGGHECSSEIAELSFQVGKIIAENSYILACGGLTGVMHHACKGAKSAGGTTIGILPSTSKDDANPYVDIAIPTGIGLARNMIVVLAADVLVAVNGSYGTLSEIAYALQFRKKVFGLRTEWHVSDDVEVLKDISALGSKLRSICSSARSSIRPDGL